MLYLTKNYIGVHTKVENYHKEHKEKASILTEFKIDWKIVSFKATVETSKGIFNWSSFWTTDKEKAFEKLETVAVWRALAFAGYEIKSWIASQEEIEEFEKKEKSTQADDNKPWFNEKELFGLAQVKDNYTKDTVLAEVKRKYKVSKKMTWEILELYK